MNSQDTETGEESAELSDSELDQVVGAGCMVFIDSAGCSNNGGHGGGNTPPGGGRG